MAWNGYRVGRIGGGGALNGYVAPKAKQVWEVGATVKVGFLTLSIIGKSGAEWLLQSAKGVRYAFQPHVGLRGL